MVGPEDNPEKYGLMSELGKGVYGTNYKARNLIPEKNEEDYYAVKLLHPPKTKQKQNKIRDDWWKETRCLKDVLEICKKVDILCYKDSFMTKDGEYVIVTTLLDGYTTLWKYMYELDLLEDEDEAFEIYKKVVDVKNALTDLCINHSDLHSSNIMIHPDTKDIKVIDLGRCQTPEEEVKEWKPPSEDWDLYSDEGRLKELREYFIDVLGFDEEDGMLLEEDFTKHAPVKAAKPGCQRLSVKRENEFTQKVKEVIKSFDNTNLTLDEKLNSFEEFLKYSTMNKDILDNKNNTGLKKSIIQKANEFRKYRNFDEYIKILQ